MKPVLLLIPGLLNSARVFDGVCALLDQELDVRVADVQSQSSLDTMAHDAWSSLADVPAAQPLVVAGYSMGGYVALQMLSTPRRRVQGLALICTSARADTPEGQTLRERAIGAMQRDFGRYVGALLGFLVTPQRQADVELMAKIRDDMLSVGAATAIRQHRAVALREDRLALLPQLDLLVDVIAAGADPVTPAALSSELADAIPGAQLTLVDAVGHLLPFERPAAVAAVLSDLVARVAAINHQGST